MKDVMDRLDDLSCLLANEQEDTVQDARLEIIALRDEVEALRGQARAEEPCCSNADPKYTTDFGKPTCRPSGRACEYTLRTADEVTALRTQVVRLEGIRVLRDDEISALRAERKDIITALGVYIVLTAEANAKGLAPTIPDDVRAWAESIVAAHDGGPREVFAMIRAISEEKP